MNPRLIWHFVKKDVRTLWMWIAVVMMSSAVLTVLSFLRAGEGSLLRYAWLHVSSAIAFFWISYAVFLIRLIHAEGLVGDRQHWLARPVDWRDLIAAKFITGFTVGAVPFVLYQLADLYGSGILAMTGAGEVGMRTLYLSVIWGLPVCALAVVTRTTSQAVLGAVVIGIAGSIFQSLSTIRGGTPNYTEWLALSGAAFIITVGSVGTVVTQYLRRRTDIARALLATVAPIAMAILWLMPPGTLFAMHDRVFPVANHAGIVSLDAPREYPANLREFTGGRDVAIPVRLNDLPLGWRVQGAWTSHVKVTAGGETMAAPETLTGRGSRITPLWIRNHDQYWILLPVFRSFAERHKEAEWSVEFTMQMRYFGNFRQYRLPLKGGEIEIPGVAKCRSDVRFGATFFCAAPFQIRQWMEARTDDPKTMANAFHGGDYAPMSLDTFPIATQVSAGMAPGPPAKEVVLEILDPMGTAERRVELRIASIGNFR